MKDMMDSMILSYAGDRWQKVAKIIALVSGGQNDAPSFGAIETRIRALVDEGKLEAKGDLSQWRHSEIRRRQSHP